jgi:hypothetical protein
MSIADVLQRLAIEPDFSFTSADSHTQLDYIHRRTEQEEIYYIVNPYAYKDHHNTAYQYRTDIPDNYETVAASFRVSGMQPELWNPVSGEMYHVEQFKDENGRISFELTLEPEGGIFVVFRPQESKGLKKSNKQYDQVYNTDPLQVQKIVGPWKLRFTDGYQAQDSITIPALQSWTSFRERNIKYYSGHVTYKKQFLFDKEKLTGKTIFLDLGSVFELAEVIINGQNLGVLWKAPFRVEVTDLIRSGENELAIKVVNLWCNRLILDGKLPEDEKLTRTNVIKFEQDGDNYLRESGLLGPVQLLVF